MDLSSETGATVALSPESPWPGLIPFSEADQAFFQGRRGESERDFGLAKPPPRATRDGGSSRDFGLVDVGRRGASDKFRRPCWHRTVYGSITATCHGD